MSLPLLLLLEQPECNTVSPPPRHVHHPNIYSQAVPSVLQMLILNLQDEDKINLYSVEICIVNGSKTTQEKHGRQ